VTVDGTRPNEGAGAETDEALLSGLAAGDSSALSALYDRFGRLSFGLAYRMLADQAAAEDVVQESFVSVWRNAPSFNPARGTARAWLLTTVRNRCIDVLRGPRRMSKFESPVEEAFELQASDNVLATVMQSLQAQDIQTALGHLSEEQRTTIHLAYFGGLTHAQIAAQTRVPLGTVKGRMRLALEKLRETLSSVGGMETAAEGL